jgi:hypothetical protein
VALGLAWGALDLAAQETNRWTVGVRGGIAASESSFWQSEAFVHRDLNELWNLGRGWILWPRMEFTSGFLMASSEYAYVGTTGPSLVVRSPKLPLTLNAGSRLTFLSQSSFEERDFGMPFQFTSHGGLEWTRGRWELSYRFQHMSNAALAQPNPGLNLHLFGVACRF